MKMTCTCATLYFPRKILRHRHSPFPSRLDASVPFPTHSFTLAPALSITWHFSERLLNVGFFYFDRVSAGGRRSGGASNRKRSRNKGHLPTQRQERTLNSYLNFVFLKLIVKYPTKVCGATRSIQHTQCTRDPSGWKPTRLRWKRCLISRAPTLSNDCSMCVTVIWRDDVWRAARFYCIHLIQYTRFNSPRLPEKRVHRSAKSQKLRRNESSIYHTTYIYSYTCISK